MRRTYGLVFLGVVLTLVGAAFTATQPSLAAAVAAHPFITGIAWIATVFAAQSQARSYPRNIILMLLSTFVAGVYIAPILIYYVNMRPGALAEAGLLTFAAFGALTLYATFSRRDFSAWGGFFAVGVVVLLGALILGYFFPSIGGSMWIAGAGVFVFSGLLVFDTWRITRSGQLTDQDYVLAAVSIYVDLLNLFLFILQFVGGSQER